MMDNIFAAAGLITFTALVVVANFLLWWPLILYSWEYWQ